MTQVKQINTYQWISLWPLCTQLYSAEFGLCFTGISISFIAYTELCSVQFSRSIMSNSLGGLPVHHQHLEFTQTCVHWVGDAIQPSHPVIPFSSYLQSFQASRSFPVSQFFTSGGQSTGVSASASVLPMNIQGGFPLGWTSQILQSKWLSRVFSNTTVQKHQFFSAQLSL